MNIFTEKWRKNQTNKKKRNKIGVFAFMQRLGKSFMLPISVLPVAGLLLGIGSAFSPYQNVYYDQSFAIVGPYSTGGTILNWMKEIGNFLFANLPLLFSIAIPLGLAKTNKGLAALSGLGVFLIFNLSMSALLALQGLNGYTTGNDYLLAHGHSSQEAVAISNRYEMVLGIFSLRMSVFGGIITGLIAYGALIFGQRISFKNRYLNLFFGDSKIGFIYGILFGLFFAPIIYWIWQVMFIILDGASTAVKDTGLFGTFLFGYIERALLPFGVHHTFYLPFWQTSLGGQLEIGGQTVLGAQNIFFAELQDPNLEHFSVEYGSRFWGNRNIMDIFGLPAAAVGLYLTLPKGKRGRQGSLLLSAALTSFITGITEPFEFLFLFIAPLLFWGPWCILAGLAALSVQLANIGVGTVFSGGIIEFILFGVLQGNSKTSWTQILWVGPIFSVAYGLLLYFWIKFRDVDILDRKTQLSDNPKLVVQNKPASLRVLNGGNRG